jgi:redox-sensitive bicupin YhaK (pirin superfamily)
MLTVRPAGERGRTELDWLDSRHTFSFGEYFDSSHMGFGPLRVINDDRVEPGRGFGTHGHRDMEILTWILDGELEHRDSIGSGSVIRPGEVQIMSAGTGIEHSEFNPSPVEPVHFLQIWIIPERRGLAPRYDQQVVSLDPGVLHPIADGRDGKGAVHVFQDVVVYVARLERGQQVEHRLDADRAAWVQVARGAVTLDGTSLRAGDGAAVTGEERVVVGGEASAEIILFDLAAASV